MVLLDIAEIQFLDQWLLVNLATVVGDHRWPDRVDLLQIGLLGNCQVPREELVLTAET